MKMKKGTIWFGLVIGLLGLTLAVGAQTFLKPCTHDETLAKWITAEGGLIAVFAGVGMLQPHWAAQALSALAGIITALTPGTLVKICASEQMRCRMITRPAAIVIGTITAALAIWWFILKLKSRKCDQ